MDIKKVTNTLSVSPQISKDDIASIAKQGYKTLICNRPDNEGENQTNFAEIEKRSNEEGISCYYLPVVSGKVSEPDAESMNKLLSSIEQPILAYCRTGTRSIMLWALYQVISGSASSTDVKKQAKQIGYDLSTFLS